MNETPNVTPIAVLAAYVEGRKDGFNAGVIFTVGAVILYKAVRKRSRGMSVRFVRNDKN